MRPASVIGRPLEDMAQQGARPGPGSGTGRRHRLSDRLAQIILEREPPLERKVAARDQRLGEPPNRVAPLPCREVFEAALQADVNVLARSDVAAPPVRNGLDKA